MNSGFFLLIGTLAFGFMSGIEHKALAEFFVGAPYVLAIPIAIWSIYTFKILGFNRQQLHLDENRILFNLAFLSKSEQVSSTGLCFLLQFLPALLYGSFLAATAWRVERFQSIAIILFSLSALFAIGTTIMMRNFRMPNRERKISVLKQFFDQRFRKPLIQFYAEWLLRRDPLMLAGTKIFAGALIFAICRLYVHESYDWRLISMSVTLCGFAQLLILFKLQEFEHDRISWIKNLPIAIPKRFFIVMMALTLFLVPESVVLIKHFPPTLSTFWLVMNLFYLLSLAAFFFGFMHQEALPPERFTKKAFWVFILSILLILFKVPLIILCILNFTVGFLFFSWKYYRYEPYRSQPDP
jgi:hypothetical protein